MKTVLLAAAVAATALAYAPDVEAQDFDITGAGCIPAPHGTLSKIYSNVGPGVRFTGTSTTASMFLTCPISQPFSMSAPTRLEISYTDPGANSYITATYYKVHKTTGAQTQIAVINTDSCATGTNACATPAFSDAWNPAAYYYYIFINMRNTTGTSNLVFWGAAVY